MTKACRYVRRSPSTVATATAPESPLATAPTATPARGRHWGLFNPPISRACCRVAQPEPCTQLSTALRTLTIHAGRRVRRARPRRRAECRLLRGARDVSGFQPVVNKAALTPAAQAFHFSQPTPRRGEAEPRGRLQA